MIEINLLPKEFRKRSTPFHFEKKWIYAGSVVVLTFCFLFGLTIYQKQKISTFEKKISSIQRQRKTLDSDIKLIDGLTELKQNLLTRMSAIEKLDKDRGLWVGVLENLSAHVPELLWLTGFSEAQPKAAQDRNKKTIKTPTKGIKAAPADSTAETQTTARVAQIEGYAYTLNSIASFLVGIMKSDYFKDVELAYARQESVQDVPAYNFKINCAINYEAWSRDSIQPEISVSSPLAGQ